MNVNAVARNPRKEYFFQIFGRKYAFDIHERFFRDQESLSEKDLSYKKEDVPFGALAKQFFGKDSIRHTCGISLHLVHGCNMGCYYCSVDSGLNFKGKQRMLTNEMAKDAIDFIFREFHHSSSYSINLAVGGEPLMNFDVLKFVVEYAEQKGRAAGKPVTISLVTNGLLLTKEILKFLNKKNVHTYLSVDGPEKVHNAFRVTQNGRSSYDQIVGKIDMIRNQESNKATLHPFGGVATISPLHPSIIDVVDHLLSLGFKRIAVNPVRSDSEKPYAITEHNINSIKQAYSDFAERMLESALKNDFTYMNAILNHSDFMGRFIIRLLMRNNAVFRCTAGKWGFSITADGGIYPCDEFVGMNEYRIGDIFSGIDQIRLNEFHNADIESLRMCSACWAKHICGGLCPKDSIALFGEIGKPNQIECSLIKHVIKLGIHIICTLQRARPELYKVNLLGKANEILQNRNALNTFHSVLNRLAARQRFTRFGVARASYGYLINGLMTFYNNPTARRIVRKLFNADHFGKLLHPVLNASRMKNENGVDKSRYIFDAS